MDRQNQSRALLRAAKAAGASRQAAARLRAPLLKLFVQKFSSGLYREAFALAEALLDLRDPSGNEVVSVLSAPVTARGRLYPAAELAARLRSLYALRAAPGQSHWKYYYLVYLASAPAAGGGAAWEKLRRRAVGEWRRIRPADLARYGWMFKEVGRKRLFAAPPDYRGACAAFRKALCARPPEWDVYGRLAEAELCRGRRAAAFGWLEKALADFPEQAGDLLAWRGELKLFCGDWPGALRDLDGAAAKSGYYALTWRALALAKAGRTGEALACAERAAAFNPRDGEALVVRGELRRLVKDYAGARADLQWALRGGFPYRHGLWAGLNLVLLELLRGGRPGRALAKLRRQCAASAGARALWRRLAALAADRPALQVALEGLFSRTACRRDEPYLFPLWLSDGPRA